MHMRITADVAEVGACRRDNHRRHILPAPAQTAEDLDPALSRHHLTTLKRAYLKLRHLVDAGCVFVGHDLEKDFRMINIVVPPEQVRQP